uniref:Uncharacterized protein n=1 Tax=Plectus sambesii TaxID=2011161 RepID=A0A914W9S5_9BILA
MDGFAVLGNEQRICQADGTFSDAFGTCQAVCADYPEDDPNANPITYDQTPHFLTSGITRTCMPGFVIVQPNEANCIENPAGSNTLDWDMMLGLCAPAGK